MFRVVLVSFLLAVLVACEPPIPPPGGDVLPGDETCEPVVIYIPVEPSEPDCANDADAGEPDWRKLAIQVRNRGSSPVTCATRRWDDPAREWRELDAVAAGGSVQTLDYFEWDTLEAEGTTIRCDDLEIVGWIDAE